MKLTKLLPMTTIAGVAAIVIPLVTSCSQKGTTVTWNEGDVEPLSDSDIASSQNYDTSKEATVAYFDAINNDKTLLAKDEICSMIKAFTTKHISARIDAIDVEKQTITSSGEADVKAIDPLTEESRNEHFELETQNVEYEIRQAAPGLIYFEPKLYHAVVAGYVGGNEEKREAMIYAEELAKDKTWYFYAREAFVGYSLSQRIDYTNVYDYVSTMIEESGTPAYLTLEPFAIQSRYFSKITIGE